MDDNSLLDSQTVGSRRRRKSREPTAGMKKLKGIQQQYRNGPGKEAHTAEVTKSSVGMVLNDVTYSKASLQGGGIHDFNIPHEGTVYGYAKNKR